MPKPQNRRTVLVFEDRSQNLSMHVREKTNESGREAKKTYTKKEEVIEKNNKKCEQIYIIMECLCTLSCLQNLDKIYYLNFLSSTQSKA